MSKPLELTSTDIRAGRFDVEEAENHLLKMVKYVQRRCKHPKIGEAPYQHSEYGASYPEVRVCLHCGMTEDGWGPGFQVLKEDHPIQVSRDEVNQLAIGLRVTDDHKTRLLQKRGTVADFVGELQPHNV